jgi:antitoxin component HigA of HigAB toxin-antitoxin module
MRIESKEQHEKALEELNSLWDKPLKVGTKEWARFDELAQAVDAYEREHIWPGHNPHEQQQ